MCVCVCVRCPHCQFPREMPFEDEKASPGENAEALGYIQVAHWAEWVYLFTPPGIYNIYSKWGGVGVSRGVSECGQDVDLQAL